MTDIPAPADEPGWGGLAPVLAGAGEAGRLIASADWSATAVGPPSGWPTSLRVALGVCLSSRFPIVVWWGPEFVMLYNDGYAPLAGAKHPAAMGRPGREVWPEIWDTIGPMLDGVWAGQSATWSENQQLYLRRHGYLEEAYFTFSYSAIRDETGALVGIFSAVTEGTRQVLGERRLRALRDLADRTAEARSDLVVAERVSEALAGHPADVPFALLYLPDTVNGSLRLMSATGLPPGHPARPVKVAEPVDPGVDDGTAYPLWATFADRSVRRVGDLAARFGDLPRGAHGPVAHEALVLPVGQTSTGVAHSAEAAGVLVVGVNPRRRLDDDYTGFLGLLAGHVATALSDARAFTAERTRAESLAELDRAKTVFMSDVSHEFRTPLTLLLGPAMDALADEQDPQQRQRLELITRNATRLLRLVNTLLDYTRLEAGRADPQFVDTDLTALTIDVASLFRSAIESAGLSFTVSCQRLPCAVRVDPEMWEKVVLNLLSNALKYTMTGSVSLSLGVEWGAVEHQDPTTDGREVVLRVSDTGAGIPAEALPALFERFHRVRGTAARSREGTGIGLAMVHEIMRLHDGSVTASSVPGEGSSFEVRLPLARTAPAAGPEPADAGVAAGERLVTRPPAPLVTEALSWLEEVPPATGPTSDGGAGGEDLSSSRVLVVDDNADLRAYLTRLLADHYEVQVVGNAEEALATITAAMPDLVLTDVMLPGMDGFELLRRLRARPTTARLPVIVLSARAGEEAAVAGLSDGADDYLVKPFSARELLARVRANLQLTRLREAAAVEATRHARRLDDLARAALATTSALTVEEALAVLAEQARRLIPAHQAAASLTTGDTRSRSPATVSLSDRYAGWADREPGTEVADVHQLVVATNQPLRLTHVELEADPRWRGSAAGTGAEGERPPMRGLLAVPLVARDGSNLGLVQVSDRVQGDFTAEDEAVLVQLAQMAAVRIETAQAYERERAVAVELQRSLLPQVPPTVAGLMVAARYLPGAAGTQVGGDWYDVIELSGARTGLVIGDVMGRGVRAAAVMGQLRAASRGYALEGLDPAEVLTRLDSVVRSIDESQLTTCAYGVFDPADSTLRIATAGHLPPLLSTGDGTARLVDLEPGLPLGVGDGDVRYTALTVTVPAGATLLMFTDGLVEDHEMDVGTGLEMLTKAMAEPAASAEEACDRALRAMGRDVAHDDDTALLAVCTVPVGAVEGQRTADLELSRSPRSAAEARRFVTTTLRSWDLDQLADMAALLVSELVTNAVVHANSGLLIQVMAAPAAVKVAVSDRSTTLPVPRRSPDDAAQEAALRLAEGGRGLMLVEAIADRWGADAQPAGKRVWFELDTQR